jgi:hypothetical protein
MSPELRPVESTKRKRRKPEALGAGSMENETTGMMAGARRPGKGREDSTRPTLSDWRVGRHAAEALVMRAKEPAMGSLGQWVLSTSPSFGLDLMLVEANQKAKPRRMAEAMAREAFSMRESGGRGARGAAGV